MQFDHAIILRHLLVIFLFQVFPRIDNHKNGKIKLCLLESEADKP